MVGHRTSGTPNVRGNIGRLRMNSRSGSALTGRRDNGGPTSLGRRGLERGAAAPQEAATKAKGALDTADDDHDLQEGAEDSLAESAGAGLKRTGAAAKKAAGKTAPRNSPKTVVPGRAGKDGRTLTRGSTPSSSRAKAGRGGLGAGRSVKGGLAAAKKRAAQRRMTKLAQKRAKKTASGAAAQLGLPTSPLGAARGVVRSARVVQLAVQAASAAASAVRAAIAAVAAIVSSTPLLIALVAVLAVIAIIVAILAVLPGLGDEAQKEEQAICTTGEAAITANVNNLPFSVAGYGHDELVNAAIIVEVAKQSGFDRRGQLIGLITAMQEADLGRDKGNLQPNSDGDAGIFQQRQNAGWYGSLAMVTDPTYAANAFYNGVTAQSPGDWGSVGGGTGYGHLPGLKDIPNWQTMEPTLAASAVQKPAERYRYEYAKHELKANQILNALGNTTVELGTGGGTAGCGIGGVSGAATGTVKAVIDYAMSWQGKGLTYNMGGGNLDGPTNNTMDCSSFVGAAWKKGAGITFGRSAQDQWNNLAAYRVSADQLQPGDLIFEAAGRRGEVGNPDAISHVGMYIGNGQMVEWGRSANGFHVGPVQGRINADAYVGAARPPAPDAGQEGTS